MQLRTTVVFLRSSEAELVRTKCFWKTKYFVSQKIWRKTIQTDLTTSAELDTENS